MNNSSRHLVPTDTPETTQKEIRAFSGLLPDGVAYDTVSPKGSTNLVIVRQEDGKRVLREAVEANGTHYLPPALDPGWLQAVRFPSHAAQKPERISSLFAALEKLFAEVTYETDIIDELTFSTLSTWFADVLPIAPTLLLIDNGDGSTDTVARVLQGVCRHALVLNEFSQHSCLQLPQGLVPTLFLDQLALPPRAPLLIARTSRASAYAIRDHRPVAMASSKVIRCRTPFDVPEIDHFAISVVTSASGKSAAGVNFDPGAIAAEHQPRLLAYRLANLSRVHSSHFLAEGVEGDLQELVRSLGMSCEGSRELQDRLLKSFARRNEELRAERSTRPEAVVLEALLSQVHDNQAEVRVAELCEVANEIFKLRAERQRLGNREVGSILKSLGLPTERLDRMGRGLRLTGTTRERVHELARLYSTPATAEPFTDCHYCATE